MSIEVPLRSQPIDFHTSKGINNSDPDECTYNFADSGTLTPNYPAETSMELAITSVCFPNMLTAVQSFNSTCFLTYTASGASVVFPVVLANQNFKGLSGLANVVQTAFVAATSVAWTVVANATTNTLTFTAPSNLLGTYTLTFVDTLVNGLFQKAYASSCGLLGFKQTDILTFVAGQAVTSTVPCQASGANLIYIACDLFSLDGATVDVFGSSRRGTLLGKLQITDAPWTTSTYQDQLLTFRLKLPAFNISQMTVYLLNEYLQKPGMPVDWSMSGVVTYFTPSPIIQINQKLDEVVQYLKFMWISEQHAHDDNKAIAKEQNRTLKQLASMGIIRG